MQSSALVSLKSVLVIALLGGSLLFAVLSLDAPAWRRWTKSTTVSAEADGSPQPAPLRVDEEDSRPLGAVEDESQEAGLVEDVESEGAGDEVAEGGGPQLALALEDSDEGQIVEAVGSDSGEADAVAPVFWGEELKAGEPGSGNLTEGDGLVENAAEPGLLPVDPDAEEPQAVEGDEVSRDTFSALERRLRELGATQYRLETWGAEGELFRFRCLVAISDTERYNRFFEATDPDAQRAFEKVLEEVEAWRANQQARAR